MPVNRPQSLQHPSFRGRIGIARTEITPPVGIYARNWGAAAHDVAESIHRPLYLTALTISTDDTSPPLILVDADLGWWRPLNLFWRFRDQVTKELDVSPDRFLFALTHTHSAAPLMEPDPDLPGSELLRDWLATVPRATVRVVRDALGSAFEGILDWQTGRCSLASIRDLPDPEDPARRFLCGYNPALKADDTLLVGRVTDSAGTVRAVVANYACHPTTLAWQNSAISPDYIGAYREVVEAATGATAFFLQGNSGELAPRQQYTADVSVADRHGRQLAHAALAALSNMEPSGSTFHWDSTVESGAPLAVWKHDPIECSQELRAVERGAELKLKDWPTADALERERQQCSDRALQERIRRKRDIRRALGDGVTFSLPVHAWRLGDAVLVGTCCEGYSILQQQLRTRFSEHAVVCLNLVNGSIGYLPPAPLYDSDIYPVWQTPFDRGSLESLAEVMTTTISELLQ